MELRYGLSEFRQDLLGTGILDRLPDRDSGILMSLLDGSLETWAKYLAGITDVYVFIEPNQIIRRTTEIVCVFGGWVVKIENKRDCAWRDYNGMHYFTDHLYLYANSEQPIKQLLANFREFLKTSGIESLKEQTIQILPAWSEAFIHRMPNEVQAFFFSHRRFLTETAVR